MIPLNPNIDENAAKILLADAKAARDPFPDWILPERWRANKDHLAGLLGRCPTADEIEYWEMAYRLLSGQGGNA